jgi:PAS domain S-box-containing protein
MNQAIKTKKIEKRTKKIKPGINDKKALNPFLKKKRSGTAKEIVGGGGKNPARKDIELGLEKTRKELAVIKKSADEASEFAESIINTAREPLIALDQYLRIVKVNRSFYDFFKVKPEDTVGQLIYDLGNRQWDIPKLRELLETILPQKASFDNYEVEHEFTTIGRRVMLLNARQIQRAFGKEKIILLAIEDITEHKRLEILLMESEELYKGVYKTASDGIVLLEKREGRISQVNPAAEKMLGYSAKECIGNKLQDIGFILDLGDFQTIMQNLNKHGIINYEAVPVKTKSGQHLDTDIYLVDKTKVVQCNIRDITDRTRAEESLRKSENNFRRSLDDSPLGVRIVTPKGETIYANRTILDLYGYASMDEINRIPIKERYTPQSYAEFQTRKKDREDGDFGPSQYEINIVRENGEIRHLQVLRKEILWNGTKQFQVIYQDITERKQAEEKIRNSLAEKEVLLKEVHHRVKNNLMIIIGLIKMEETKANNEMFNPLLQELEGRIRSMAQVHESLYLSKYLTHIDLQNYIETISGQISAQFGSERNIYFSVQAAGVMVGLDKAISCGLILNELITNACKHAFPGGKPGSGAVRCEINVIAVQDGGELILTVANNGVGLPADLDWEKSESLGLQLVKMLIKQINGSIELDRSAGTAFRLKFSVADKIH